MKTLLIILLSISNAYALNEGFHLKFFSDMNNQKFIVKNKEKTLLSNRTFVGAEGSEGNHNFYIMYGQEYIKTQDANDAMKLGYGYKLNYYFDFKLHVNINNEIFYYYKNNELNSSLVTALTINPQLQYYAYSGKTTRLNIFGGLISQHPSEMKVSGMKNYVPVDAKRGFGCNLGMSQEFKISEKQILEVGTYYQRVNRSTKSVANQTNEQLHVFLGFSHLLD